MAVVAVPFILYLVRFCSSKSCKYFNLILKLRYVRYDTVASSRAPRGVILGLRAYVAWNGAWFFHTSASALCRRLGRRAGVLRRCDSVCFT